MKRREETQSSAANGSAATKDKRPRHRGWRRFGIVLLVLVVLGIAIRAAMPWAVRKYVNRTLDRNQLYSGKIGPLHIHLWRGAYSIEDISISKTTGNVPVPFFAARRVDFALQWDALLHHKLVGRMLLQRPELNFVDSSSESDSQTGAGAPWLEVIKDLFPFKINSAIVSNGIVHFRAFKGPTPVDVYISDFNASVDNLSNIRDETKPLISTVKAEGMVMDQAKFEYNMTLDPFAYRPTFHMAVRLLGLDVTKINDLALAYGKFDFKRGWFDFVMEADARDGEVSGYAKPLFRNLKVFSLAKDVKEDNPLQFFWQALVGAVTAVFKNQSKDQFGTLIPFSADETGTTTTDILATIGNLLRNAFIRAYLPRLEGQQSFDGMKFEPPDVSSPVSADQS
jgi:Domain of Unknown Function (DUF748)